MHLLRVIRKPQNNQHQYVCEFVPIITGFIAPPQIVHIVNYLYNNDEPLEMSIGGIYYYDVENYYDTRINCMREHFVGANGTDYDVPASIEIQSDQDQHNLMICSISGYSNCFPIAQLPYVNTNGLDLCEVVIDNGNNKIIEGYEIYTHFSELNDTNKFRVLFAKMYLLHTIKRNKKFKDYNQYFSLIYLGEDAVRVDYLFVANNYNIIREKTIDLRDEKDLNNNQNNTSRRRIGHHLLIYGTNSGFEIVLPTSVDIFSLNKLIRDENIDLESLPPVGHVDEAMMVINNLNVINTLPNSVNSNSFFSI